MNEYQKKYHKEYMERIESCRTSKKQSISSIIHSSEYMTLMYERSLTLRKKYINAKPKRHKKTFYEKQEYQREYQRQYRAKRKNMMKGGENSEE